MIGGYWQWGRKGPDPSQWYDTNTENFAHGPTGPGLSEANAGEISGWDITDAPGGAWSDSDKTANDPCPAGFRVPTKIQWDGVLGNNTQSIEGTWSTTWDDHTNYSAARYFGDALMLPAAGYRNYYFSGALYYRGGNGYYWSSSEYSSSYNAWHLSFGSFYAGKNYSNRQIGFSVRCCISEEDQHPLNIQAEYQAAHGWNFITWNGKSNVGARPDFHIIIRRLIIPDVGKLKNIDVILHRQHAFAGRRTYFHGAVEVGVVAWVSLTADRF